VLHLFSHSGIYLNSTVINAKTGFSEKVWFLSQPVLGLVANLVVYAWVMYESGGGGGENSYKTNSGDRKN
jgi:hypothetical protein